MTPFTTLTGVAAPLPMINIDTDMIIPKQFLKTVRRTGLGAHLFEEMRRTPAGDEIADFVLNRPAFRSARILIARDNFGCGSSREHAPWALLDFGIRCVIAPSFADIFFGNCFQNGILPVVLPSDAVTQLLAYAESGREMTVDLHTQTVSAGDLRFGFSVEDFRRTCLLQGLDFIDLTLKHADEIATFETALAAREPWSA